MDIVVSHYNSHDFENFVDFLSNNITASIVIYDKSNTYNNDKYNVVPRDNVGREGETYLNHIISNYDNLNEYTLFIQDDTENHIPNNEVFLEQCKDVLDKSIKFKMFETTWRKGWGVYKRTVHNGMCNLSTLPSDDSIKLACEMHNIDVPEIYTTETCAFFVCNREIIKSKTIDFYIHLREWLLEADGNGFVLEHMWHLIFM